MPNSVQRAIVKPFLSFLATGSIALAAVCFTSGINRSLQTNYSLNPSEILWFFVDNLVEINLATTVVYSMLAIVFFPLSLVISQIWFNPIKHPVLGVLLTFAALIFCFLGATYAAKKAGELYAELMKSNNFETNLVVCSEADGRIECGRKLFSRAGEGICVVIFDSEGAYIGPRCWEKNKFEIKEI